MAAPVARTLSRPLLATAVAALLLLVLSGCVKLNADFHVDAEETLSGSMQILVDPIALEDMGSPDPSQDLDDAVSEARSDSDAPDGVTVDRVEDEDGYIGMGVTFDRVPASELRNGGGGLGDVGVEGIEIVHSDGEISFSMANPLTAGSDASDPFGSTSGMPSTARSMFDEAVVSVTFPGNVIAADGAETNGTTATWNLREYDGDTLTATGETSSFPWGTVLIVSGVLLFLLIVVGVVVLLLVVQRNRLSNRSDHLHPTVPLGGGQFPGQSGGSSGYPGSPYGSQHVFPQAQQVQASFESDRATRQDPRSTAYGGPPASGYGSTSGGRSPHGREGDHGSAAEPNGSLRYPAGPNAPGTDARSRFAPPRAVQVESPTDLTSTDGPPQHGSQS